MTCAPVLLIGFNRPDFMAAQIAAIRAARPSRVYVSVDGPRKDRPGEEQSCRLVRECVKLIDWPCEVRSLFRNENLGCRAGVSEAIGWFFGHEPEGIVLEDDCRPTLDFLRFATEMLARYRDDEHIGAVNGFNPFNLQTDDLASYHFSAHMDVWGWASWRRVWKNYTVDMSGLGRSPQQVVAASSMTRYMKKVYQGHVKALGRGLSTWDVQMSILFLDKGLLSIVPKNRLIANAGVEDDRATHTGGYVYWGKDWSSAGSLQFPLIHPVNVVCDRQADLRREEIEGAILPRALTFLGSKFPFLRTALSAVGKGLEFICPVLFRI
jgi:hypothetical protein